MYLIKIPISFTTILPQTQIFTMKKVFGVKPWKEFIISPILPRSNTYKVDVSAAINYIDKVDNNKYYRQYKVLLG